MNEITIEHAKEMRTTKGALFVELAKSQLEWIKDAPTTTSAQKEAARLILEDRERVEAAKTTYATGAEVAPPAAFQPAPKAVPDGIMISHLVELTNKIDRLTHLVSTLNVAVNNCADLSVANSENITKFTAVFTELLKANKDSAQTPRAQAPGHLLAGDKPLKQEHATRFVLEHKDGKVRVSFWDDDKPKLKFAVLTNTMSAQDWAKMIPWVNVQAWKPASVLEWATAFPNAKKQNEIEFRCNLFYTDSDNLTANGNPYKDLQRIQPDDF